MMPGSPLLCITQVPGSPRPSGLCVHPNTCGGINPWRHTHMHVNLHISIFLNYKIVSKYLTTATSR